MNHTNILLMEDDRLIAQDIKDTLTRQGYKVVSGYPDIFNAGEDFPENIDRLVHESQIGLVLMDINLSSQLDGIDLVKHIHRKSDIPVIYISGVSKPVTILRAKETEPYAYLLKPFSPEQLSSQVEMTLQLYRSAKQKKADLDEKTGVWYLSVAEGKIQTSFTWLKKFGFAEQAIGSEEAFFGIIHPEDAENVRFSLDLICKRLVSRRAFEYRIVMPSDEIRWVLSKIVDARKGPAGEFNYTILSLDVTQQKVREEVLRYDSSHDNLTGLLNRKAFMHELKKLMRESGVLKKNFALIFSDLDKFKQINDEHGHETGDALLQSVAERFQHAIKKKDFLARFGGDEFAFIIRDLKKSADIHFVAQRIVNSLLHPISIGNLSLKISVSLGVAMPEAVSGTAESLLRDADKAMYQAKKESNVRYKIFRHLSGAPLPGGNITAPQVKHH